MSKTALYFYDQHQSRDQDMSTDVLTALSQSYKMIPPKYFYDEKGSQLFEKITQLDEYYLTRTEISILKQCVSEIKDLIESHCVLVEYGSGSSEKIRILLETIRPEAYVPMDISKEFLFESADRLVAEFPWLEVHATCVDYSQEVELPYRPEGLPLVGFFPGSSIGNFTHQEAKNFLCRVSRTLGTGNGFIIGVDTKKDARLLHAAYNDREGVTSEFNLNVLDHINEQLQGNLDRRHFRHVAEYNESLGRVEMYLESTIDQVAQISGKGIKFRKGERIHTENSYKYHIEEFEALAKECGFELVQHWMDENELFAVYYFKVI